MSLSGRLLLSFTLLAATACGGYTTNNNGGNNNPNPPGLPGGNPAPSASVTVDDNLYTPNSVLLAVGGEVTWNWVGSDGHSVTSSGSPTFSPNAPVRSAPFTLQVTFPTAGDYRYFCTVHGQASYYSSGDMVGAIFVR